MSRDSVMKKIANLLKLADPNRNPDEFEVAAAAAKAQELMDRHNIESIALDMDGEVKTPEEPILNFGQMPEGDLDKVYAVHGRWPITLASWISKLNGCKIYTSWNRQKFYKGIQIIGRPSNAETVRYLYAWQIGRAHV